MRFTNQELYNAINTSLTTGASLLEVLDSLQPPISVGDVVKLKSGGPWMTVQSAFGGSARCKWFRDGTCSEEQFSLDALEKSGQK